MKRLFLILALLFNSIESQSQTYSTMKTDLELQNKLESIVSNFKGIAGVYVINLTNNSSASINGDSIFPTASMIKIPIMLTIFDKISKGEMQFNQELAYEGEHNYVYEPDFINRLEKGTKVSISKLLSLMIGYSDNTASLWLQHLAGTGTEINDWLSINGYITTRVNSRTPGRENEYKQFGWGMTTPKEMVDLALSIYEGKAISKEASDKMYRLMSRSYWDGESLSQIPPFVQTASKQGAVSQSKSEVVIVNAKNSTYLFCVITDKQEVVGYESNNPGYVFLREISRTIYQHFEPTDTWKPLDYSKTYH